ncbi:MAG: ATP-binding cassette domain-containing protein [Tenuifilaceae bacterium]|jgi:molybdopterin-binding protein|nr:ATP-binding cassette domain-containing protein [Tenuifilaceae bacterium]
MLRVDAICKSYKEFSLSGVSFSVEQGDYFMLLGPSGAGKSVVLEIIAGLIAPVSGSVYLDDVDITTEAISSRGVGLVFQDLALFPHLTVFQNIAFPLKRKGVKGDELSRRVGSLAQKLQVTHLLKRSPSTLSGGEAQRVALARTLALEPRILLLDEPLAAVDVELRAELRALLRSLNREGQTILHVTHDYEEAISLGSKVAVMADGRVAQQGTIEEVFQNPASDFVAKFSGIRNFYPVTASPLNNGNLRVATLSNSLSISFYSDDTTLQGYICIPENTISVSVQKQESSQQNTFSGRVIDVFKQRFGYELVVDILGVHVAALITEESLAKLTLTTGTTVWVSFKATTVRFIAV